MSESLNQAIAEHDPSHVFALFSGGHDSLCSTAVAAKHPRFSAAVHINTGVGIEETREFVRSTCAEHGHIEDIWARRLRSVNRQQMRMDLALCQACITQEDS